MAINWSLRLREDHILRVFEQRMLRRRFGRKGDEVTGGWKKLHNKEGGMGGACSTHGDEKCTQNFSWKA
jgi:hypothetical protein